MRTFRDGVADLDALDQAGLLKAEHFLHLRCEVPALDMLELFDGVADHRAGADGQPDGSQPRGRPVRRYGFLSRAAPAWRVGRRNDRTPHRRNAGTAREVRDRTGARCWNALPAATSHWRATMTAPRRKSRRMPPTASDISEFPVTMAAARAAKAAAWQVIAGAPNIVRGGSHSGNVAARRSAARTGRSMRSPRTTCRTAWWKRRSSAPQRIGSACRRRWPW